MHFSLNFHQQFICTCKYLVGHTSTSLQIHQNWSKNSLTLALNLAGFNNFQHFRISSLILPYFIQINTYSSTTSHGWKFTHHSTSKQPIIPTIQSHTNIQESIYMIIAQIKTKIGFTDLEFVQH